MKHTKRYMAFLLSAILIFSSITPSLTVNASDLEKKKQETMDQIKDIKSDINSVKNTIKNLQTSKSNLQSYINELDKESEQLNTQIEQLGKDIEQKNIEIDETQIELEKAIQVVEKQYDAMKLRIQYMYENGNYSYVTMLLEAASISDFLNRAEFAGQMVEYDRKMLNSFQEARQTVEDTKVKLEEEEKELVTLQSEVEEQQKAVELLIDTKSAEIAQYQQQIANAEDQADDYAAQLKKQEQLLDQIEDQIAAEAAANGATAGVTPSASGFVWPCPGSHRITSTFGPRTSPTAGASSNHKGIDIGAPTGTAIVASAGGVVTTSRYSSSAGNYIVISHGGGISTVYMHCSKLYVSVGANVSQGQTIAAVGSTGYSTGPHLHFGVIVNGSYVNPLNYVK